MTTVLARHGGRVRYRTTSCSALRNRRAIQVLEAHMWLDPFYGPNAPGLLGVARYMLKQYSDALPPLRECAARVPNIRYTHVCLFATYAQLETVELGPVRGCRDSAD